MKYQTVKTVFKILRLVICCTKQIVCTIFFGINKISLFLLRWYAQNVNLALIWRKITKYIVIQNYIYAYCILFIGINLVLTFLTHHSFWSYLLGTVSCMLKKFLNHPLNWTRNEYYTYCSVRAEPNYENIFFEHSLELHGRRVWICCQQRRRIELEDKAKVITSDEGTTVYLKKTEVKQLAWKGGRLNSTVCFKKTRAKQLARQGGRLNSTICFKKTRAKQIARQGFCPPIRCDELCLVF